MQFNMNLDGVISALQFPCELSLSVCGMIGSMIYPSLDDSYGLYAMNKIQMQLEIE